MTKRISKRMLTVIICVSLALFIATGSTLAYLFAKTPSLENTFEPVYVSCLVEENFDGVTKSNVRIKNTGDISSYMRATFVVMWVADNGSVHSSSPVENVDYKLTLGSSKWQKGSDGFYYYSYAVESGNSADEFITSLTLVGEAPTGYSLSVHVAATAIQAEPTHAVTEAWGVSVLGNGSITPP